MQDQRCRLYLITPPALEPAAFADELKQALDAGDVACVQLRLKQGDGEPAADDDFARATDVLMPIVQRYDAAFIINDRPDLAARFGADGAHVGQEDMAYADARKLLGDDRIVGVTCHNSKHLAMIAGEAGADYVAFGAFFPTETKLAKTRAEPELLTWWQQLFEPPCVAIGGITVDNAPELIRAGADFLAVSAGVWRHADGPAAAVAAFNTLFASIERQI